MSLAGIHATHRITADAQVNEQAELKRGTSLLAQRANIDRYPPVLSQLRLLAGRFDSTVVDSISALEPDDFQTAPNVMRLRLRGEGFDSRFSLANRFSEFRAFSRRVRQQLALGPHVAVAYDADAAAVLLRSPRGTNSTKRIVHLHELLEPSTASRSTRLSIGFLVRKLSRADLVVVPDSQRARVVAAQCGLPNEPLVAMNCPLRLAELPESRLLPSLRERGFTTSRIAHYQGAIGPDHHLETIISSMPHWPSDAVFVIVGAAREEYRLKLEQLAAARGVAARVIWLGRVPYRELLSYSIGASVGLTFLEPTTENWRLSAGASNKRFEYAALGIAQITNAGPGMEEVFGRPEIAVILDQLDPQSMGNAIGGLLSNATRNAAMGERARLAHLSTNNYERQFSPVLEQLESWLGDRA